MPYMPTCPGCGGYWLRAHDPLRKPDDVCQACERMRASLSEITVTIAPQPVIAQNQTITDYAPLLINGRCGRELVRFNADGTVLIEGEPVPVDPAVTVKQLRDWCDAVEAFGRQRRNES